MPEDRIEVIVKYSNGIDNVAADLQAEVEILLHGYAIITIDPILLPELYSYPQIESIELPKTLYINSTYNLTSTCVSEVQNRNSFGLDGSGVIVGIIDSGIDYTHLDFRNEDGTTRILFLWDQSGSGTPPVGFVEGAEYDQSRINQALESDDPRSIVNSVDYVGHGTAVAGIAAGNGRASNGVNRGVAPGADLIVVKVGVRGYESFARATELMRALKYVIDKARQLRRPVVINMSFGMNNGSHLGDSIFETYISDSSNEWKNSIVIPTGNEGAADHHYSGIIRSNQALDVDFFTASGIQQFYISMWKNFTDILSVEIIFPNQSTSGIITIQNQIETRRIGNLILSVIYGQPSRYSIQQEIFFQVTAETGTIATGVWKLRIYAQDVVDGTINIWLPTVEEVTARTQFATPTIFQTMTIPSTADKVIKVSGYNDRIGSIAEFSGVGSQNLALPNPDLAAPAVDILTTSTGGGYDSYSGTSMAAPFVTGAVALMMEWGIVNNRDPFLYGERVRAFLRLGARRTSSMMYPNPTFGYGTLCLNKTMEYLEQYYLGGNNIWIQN